MQVTNSDVTEQLALKSSQGSQSSEEVSLSHVEQDVFAISSEHQASTQEEVEGKTFSCMT